MAPLETLKSAARQVTVTGGGYGIQIPPFLVVVSIVFAVWSVLENRKQVRDLVATVAKQEETIHSMNDQVGTMLITQCRHAISHKIRITGCPDWLQYEGTRRPGGGE